MTHQFPPDLEQFVTDELARGSYTSEDELIAEAVRLLKKRDELRADIAQGLEELDRGERLDADEVFAELRQRAAELDNQVL